MMTISEIKACHEAGQPVWIMTVEWKIILVGSYVWINSDDGYAQALEPSLAEILLSPAPVDVEALQTALETAKRNNATLVEELHRYIASDKPAEEKG